mmetsp:Transcript_63817/g.161767  ORF Transcript_63817/g.161767 Transcript_63817/m.161767 type:complete len:228 (+) Transcript_63817:184-867(+)
MGSASAVDGEACRTQAGAIAVGMFESGCGCGLWPGPRGGGAATITAEPDEGPRIVLVVFKVGLLLVDAITAEPTLAGALHPTGRGPVVKGLKLRTPTSLALPGTSSGDAERNSPSGLTGAPTNLALIGVGDLRGEFDRTGLGVLELVASSRRCCPGGEQARTAMPPAVHCLTGGGGAMRLMLPDREPCSCGDCSCTCGCDWGCSAAVVAMPSIDKPHKPLTCSTVSI